MLPEIAPHRIPTTFKTASHPPANIGDILPHFDNRCSVGYTVKRILDINQTFRHRSVHLSLLVQYPVGTMNPRVQSILIELRFKRPGRPGHLRTNASTPATSSTTTSRWCCAVSGPISSRSIGKRNP